MRSYGLRYNGLRYNGLRSNGLRSNGLRSNGLRSNGRTGLVRLRTTLDGIYCCKKVLFLINIQVVHNIRM